jgi:arginase
MTQSKIMRIYGVPMDLGQTRRGVDMGPSAVRYAGLQERLAGLGYEVHDGGNVSVIQPEEIKPTDPSGRLPGGGWACNLREIAAVCQTVYDLGECCIDEEEHVVFLGGDHSISIGTVAAQAQHGPVGVVWVDAHGDINTPLTTPSGNVHGMVVAALLGDGPPELTEIGYPGPKITPEQVTYIGLRDLDPPERIRLGKGDIQAFTMRDVDEFGVAELAHRILKHFADLPHLHISLDLDGLDPAVAPGVGTPVPGGLSYRETHLLMEILADSGKVTSLDIVEVNPILDNGNATAKIAVDLAAGLFGQRII